MVQGVGPVVVGTDFSETATVALAEARRLAELLGAQLTVVHVADGPASERWAGPEQAEAWLAAAGLGAGGLAVRFGSAWVELARYAAEQAPSLLVVGSHGRSGYQPLTLGSTASRVTLHARCPVVVVSPRVAPSLLDGVAQDSRISSAARAGAGAGARDVPGSQ
jgi:nucleotide-binding universal stress UspA family protein